MDKSKLRYNKEKKVYEMYSSGRWRTAEERTCPICGDKFYVIKAFPWTHTCGKRACILAMRRKNRFGKLRESK